MDPELQIFFEQLQQQLEEAKRAASDPNLTPEQLARATEQAEICQQNFMTALLKLRALGTKTDGESEPPTPKLS